MRMKYCSRVLALLLAVSLMAGDCVPVMASGQQEVAEESVGTEALESEESDAAAAEGESGNTSEVVTGEAEESQDASTEAGEDPEENSESAEAMGEEAGTGEVGDGSSEDAEETEAVTDEASQDEVIEIVEEETAEASIPKENATVTVTDSISVTVTVPSGYSGYGDTLTNLKFSESGVYNIEVSGLQDFYIWDTTNGDDPYINYAVATDYELRTDLYEVTAGRTYWVTGTLSDGATEVVITTYKIALATPDSLELEESVTKEQGVTAYYSILGDNGDIFYLYVSGDDIGEIEENVEFINNNKSFSIESSVFFTTANSVIYTLAYYGTGSLEILVPSEASQMTISVSEELTGFETRTLSDWSGSLTVEKNTTRVYLFSSEEMQDYYVSGIYSYDDDTAEGLDIVFKSMNGLSVSLLYYYDEINGRTDYGFASPSTGSWGVDVFQYALIVENCGSDDVTVDLYSGSEIEPIEVTQDSAITTDGYTYGVYANYSYHQTQYYKFTAEATGIYNIYHTTQTEYYENTDTMQLKWMYREYSNESGETVQTVIVGMTETNNGIPMMAGDSIVFRIDDYAYGTTGSTMNTYTIVTENAEVINGTGLESVSVEGYYGFESGNWYIFTPKSSGTLEADSPLGYTYYYDRELNTWTYWDITGNWNDPDSESKLDVSAGETYFFFSNDTATLTISRTVTILDYDYYEAFIASGGAVTISDGTVEISETKTAGWSLISTVLSKISSIVEAAISGNAYWKTTKDGAFAAKDYYKLEAGEDGSLTKTALENPEDAEDGDVILVYYEPEIVWVQSMTVTSESNRKNFVTGETIDLTANLDYGQTKYKPEDTAYGASVITWESSNTDVATVDENGMVTMVGTGSATITATADIDLRNMEGQDDYVIGTYRVNVLEEAKVTGILVSAESGDDELVLAYEDTGYSTVSTTLHAAATPSNLSLTEDVAWSVTGDNADGYRLTSATGTSKTITFSEAGEYTVSATYTVDGETFSSEPVSITVKKEVPLNSVEELAFASNIQTSLTVADVKTAAIEKLKVSVEGEEAYPYSTDDFSIYVSKENDTKDSASISKGTKTYTVLYKASKEGYADTTRTFTLVYGELSFSLSTDAGTTLVLLGEEESNTTNYPTSSTVTPIYLFNGESYMETELEEKLGVTVTSLEATPKKETILAAAVNGTDSQNEKTVTVSGKGVGSSGLTVAVKVSGTTLAEETKVAVLSSKTLSFTVKSNTSVVKSIEASYTGSEDERGTLTDGDSIVLQYEDVEGDSKEYNLSLAITDYSGTVYEGSTGYPGAALKWTTTSSAIASVSGTGLNATLTVKKGATGVAKVTVTAQDSGKESLTFQVIVVDTDVRLDTSSVTVNSFSEETGKIYLYPNVLRNELLSESNASVSVKVRASESEFVLTSDNLEKNGEYITIYDSSNPVDYSGCLEVQFQDADVKKGTSTLTLEIVTTVNGTELEAVPKTVKVKNSPSQASATAKLTSAYNSFWSAKEENSYATILVTTKGEVAQTEERTPNITLAGDGAATFEIKSITQSETNSNQYILAVGAKDGVDDESIKTQKIRVCVTYEGYKENYEVVSTRELSLTVKKSAPSFAVYGYNVYSPTFYTDLGENIIQVLLEVPKCIAKDAEEGVNGYALSLTAASAKYFTITDQKVVRGADAVTLSKKGEETKLAYAILVTLRADKNKGSGVQFELTSNTRFALSDGKTSITVNSKKLTVKTAKAAGKLSLKFVDNQTGSTVTNYTLINGNSGKEYISVTPTLSSTEGGRLEYYLDDPVIVGDSANLTIKEAVDENDTIYYIITADNGFFDNTKNVSVKFTAHVKSSTVGSGEVTLSTKTLTLKKSKAVDTTATLKVKGSLNVVSPESSVTITPTFKNLPQGATIYSVDFTDSADAELYDIDEDLGTGVVTLTKSENEDPLPIAKDSISLTYKIKLADGSITKVESKAATLNVVQTATVKASTSSATLYNVSKGENYGKTIALNVTKAEGATIESVDISGLDDSGISCVVDESSGQVTFYTNGNGVAKNYTAKMTVTLDGAGTKKGKPVTYTVSVKLVLKK